MMNLKTRRLLLRKFTMDDAEAMFNNWANDPEVTKYMTWNPHKDVKETKAILSHWIKEYKNPKTIRYAITLKDTGELIGSIDIVGYLYGDPEIGYCLSRKYWNQGIMTEALGVFLDYLTSIGYDRVFIEAHVDNIASNRVIQKNGFKFLREDTRIMSEVKKEKVRINLYGKYIDVDDYLYDEDEDDEEDPEELTYEERRQRAEEEGWDEEEMDLEEFEDNFM